MTATLRAKLGGRSRFTYLGAGVAALLLIGALDVVTGSELAFSLFYLLPIAGVSWMVGRPWGIAAALLATVSWAVAEYAVDTDYSHAWIRWWNTGNRLALFVTVALLVTAVQRLLERERELARTDDLTGAANWRAFREATEAELYRLRRYGGAFSVLYCDVDNLKAINDTDGHEAGDRALRRFVDVARKAIRTSDVLARIGGDEFVLLLPQTGADAARSVGEKLITTLVADCGPSVSVGALTLVDAPASVDTVLARADRVMYRAKAAGKGTIAVDIAAPLASG